MKLILFLLSTFLVLQATVAEIPVYKCETPVPDTCVVENIKMALSGDNFTLEADDASAIKTLIIRNSKILDFHADICDTFPNIAKLVLKGNGIKHVQIQSGCDSLVEVDLSENKLAHFEIRSPKAIQVLDIHSNRLRMFYFDEFSMLKALYLQDNLITNLAVLVQKYNENVEQFYFDTNEVGDFSVNELLSYFPNLKAIGYTNNPLSCVRVREINQAFKDANVNVTDFTYFERARFYNQLTYEGVHCLSDEVWLAAVERERMTS